MILYTYACPADHFEEHFRSVSDRDNPAICKTCGQKATKVLTPVSINLEPFSGNFPSAADKWDRLHAEKLAWEYKHERQHDELK